MSWSPLLSFVYFFFKKRMKRRGNFYYMLNFLVHVRLILGIILKLAFWNKLINAHVKAAVLCWTGLSKQKPHICICWVVKPHCKVYGRAIWPCYFQLWNVSWFIMCNKSLKVGHTLSLIFNNSFMEWRGRRNC